MGGIHAYNPRMQEAQQDDHKFKTRLSYRVRPCLKSTKGGIQLSRGILASMCKALGSIPNTGG
jgi:hypothetical protein